MLYLDPPPSLTPRRSFLLYHSVRQKIVETALKAQDAGLLRLSAGNLSARTPHGNLALTPSAVHYTDLLPEQVAVLDLEGRPVDAPRRPSSELHLHLILLKHLPEVGAVLHTHSPYAITFAMLGQEIPVVNLETYACGGPIPVARWACPGTPDTGFAALEVFSARPGLKVCLLRNHGLVALGKDLDQAYEMAYSAEVGLQTYYQARLLGEPECLSPEQVAQMRQVYG
jgi:L-ribulose-5-phosphate 4-epimerase